MNRSSLRLALVITGISAILAFSSNLPSANNNSQAVLKKRVCISPIGNRDSDCGDSVISKFSHTLHESLTENDLLLVLPLSGRATVGKQQSNIIDQARRAGAQFVVAGQVEHFEDTLLAESDSTGFYQRSMSVDVRARLVDVRSGLTLAADRFEVELSGVPDSTLKLLLDHVVADLNAFIDNALSGFPWEGRVSGVIDSNHVLIEAGSNDGLRVGYRFEIIRPGQPVIDPQTGRNIGSEDKFIGCVRIENVEENRSIGVMIDAIQAQIADIVRESENCEE
jgi:uncharacterized phosphosugar-binding protein